MIDRFTYDPPTQFRGTRNYFHSTDLYQTIIGGAVEAGLILTGAIKLKIRAKIVRKPHYTYRRGDAGTNDVQASCAMVCGDDLWTALVTEGDDPIQGSKPYDEWRAFTNALLNSSEISINGETGLLPIEAITALAVHLHKNELPPAQGKRWMLGELALSRPLQQSDANTMTIKIEKKIGGRLTQCSITGKDGPTGTMLFVLAAG